MIVMNAAWEILANQAYKISQQRKELEAVEKELFAQLKELSCHQDATFGRWSLVSTTRLGNVDYGSIPELSGVNLDQYRKEGIRVWSLKPVAL